MIDDCENRTKVKRGSELPWAKLTEDDVRMARELHRQGRAEIARIQSSCTAKALAEKFDVHYRTMEKALSYETWIHI